MAKWVSAGVIQVGALFIGRKGNQKENRHLRVCPILTPAQTTMFSVFKTKEDATWIAVLH